MDGQTYTASTAEVTLACGEVYKYTLTMNSTGLTVSQVTVTPWGSEQDKGAIDTELQTFADLMHEKFQGVTTDGVYAVKSDGSPVAYADASDDSYAAVAFVVKNKAYQVAKVDATGYDNYEYVYWQKNDNTDISGVESYETVDGTNAYGYFSAPGIPRLSNNVDDWSDGALKDFNGQSNTAAILAAQSDGTLDYTIGKAVMDFRSGSNNEGLEDWFVPSCGELACMFLQRSKIKSLMGKVGGSWLGTANYWTSSVCNSSSAFYVGFIDGDLGSIGKGSRGLVRLIRAI